MHTDHRFLKYNFSRHLEVIRVQRIVLIYQIENSRQCLPLSRFWNSSKCQDGFARTTRAHLFERIQSFGWRYFYWCVYPLLETRIERCVHFHTVVSSIMSCTRSSITLPASSKNRCGSMWVYYYRAYQYTALKCYFEIHSRTSKSIRHHMHKSSTHWILQSLEPRDTCGHWLSLADW